MNKNNNNNNNNNSFSLKVEMFRKNIFGNNLRKVLLLNVKNRINKNQ